ncbi:double-strand break repair helicase AddA [Magnetospira sp. QH-2]|uniref:double-strand break repair helicase AddA n=1 Tax=Magnetospira sp. (strain QH-2) TaxID=1288970 RepID=UPI0003E8193B|nr:double-strand break repair helicase AddA [Magnetospira sp. QH-2]CCQ72590.1 putative UvrD/REP helicase (addA) [Magnetospira sp. QH-2]
MSVADPNIAQGQAADPGASVWVAASAGTGKTKVLTDRVLNLLLTGTAPHKILCLTFTKAAAAEMATRVAEKLGLWTRADEESLEKDLAKLLGRAPSMGERVRARRLFALVLDVPGGMRIETLHAFCQSVLRRFPIEAGLAPHFTVMDDRTAAELLLAAREAVLARARAGGDETLSEALSLITARVHETLFPELMGALASERGRLRQLLDRHGNDLEQVNGALRAALDLREGETPESLIADACQDEALDLLGLRLAVEGLTKGSKTDADRARTLGDWLARRHDDRVRAFSAYRGLFLTQKDQLKAQKSIVTQSAIKAAPGIDMILMTEAERIFQLDGRMKAAGVAQATAALLRIGSALLDFYGRLKERRALLDYDDLILMTRDLLRRPGVAPWVLFKLDGGLDHMLIDEAQDTNPEQWQVVEALTDEFFAGDGGRDGRRTVFAVGDAKQSIYSFQRADPKGFERMRALFRRTVPDAGQEWREVDLTVSFRSTRAVLAAVDAIFSRPTARAGVAPEDIAVHHEAFREDAGGLVELWPPVTPREEDPPTAWKPPLERTTGGTPRSRLARLVARRIDTMIHGEVLESQARPIHAGDILVLVRRRGAFVEDLVRELKRLDVPVAGVDRMVLTDQMAVMDLTALGDFLLLPDDDLTLATVLKGPLGGLSEEDLFDLAHDRPGSLWAELRRRATERPSFSVAHELLTGLLARADFTPPFELFAHVLGPLGGRKKLLARLGREADDPINEFLSQAASFERDHVASLQGFLAWLRAGDTEIKRDLENGDGQSVRVMTVHGAKGLQAPIVFLPDTLQVPAKTPALLWPGEGESQLLLWAPSKASSDAVCDRERDRVAAARDAEYRRLLYVALTRAEDRLYVCGWETKNRAPETCWYNLVRDGLDGVATALEDRFLAQAPETESAEVLRLSSPQTAIVDARETGSAVLPPLPLPDWAEAPPPDEPDPPRPLIPSRPDDEEPPVRAPLGRDGGIRFRRGRLIHRLLQALPDLDPQARDAAARRFLSGAARHLSEEECREIIDETLSVLDHPDHAALFGPGSRAEVPLAGLIGGRAISAQVDRLLVTEEAVWLVDFKSNRPPPTRAEDVAPLYLRQMAAYRALLREIYGDRPVHAILLWTDGPTMMALPEDLICRYAP